MPEITDIVLVDGESTPVTHTFAPIQVDGILADYTDRALGIPIGQPTLSISLRKPQNGSSNGVYKATFKLLVPTLEVTSPSTATGIQPAPTVAYTTQVAVDFLLPMRGTKQERKNVRVMLRDLLDDPTTVAVVDDLANVY